MYINKQDLINAINDCRHMTEEEINKEFNKDKIKFNDLIEFIDICHEYELNSKGDLTIEFYNTTVGEIDKLATKYQLHNENRYDPWYELHDLWPRMKIFFNNKQNDPLVKKQVKNFLKFADNILKQCDEYYTLNQKSFDPTVIIEIARAIATQCEWWYKTLELDIEYEEGVHTEEELIDKLNVLRKWLKMETIPKKIDTY